jgi:hypothetical protein
MKAKSWPGPPSNAPCPQRQAVLQVMSANGTKRTNPTVRSISAFDPKRTFRSGESCLTRGNQLLIPTPLRSSSCLELRRIHVGVGYEKKAGASGLAVALATR